MSVRSKNEDSSTLVARLVPVSSEYAEVTVRACRFDRSKHLNLDLLSGRNDPYPRFAATRAFQRHNLRSICPGGEVRLSK